MKIFLIIVTCLAIAAPVMSAPCDVPQSHLNWTRSTYVQSAKIQYQQVYRKTKDRKDLYYSINLLKEAACRYGSDPDFFFMLGTFYAEINSIDTMSAYFDSVDIRCNDTTIDKDKRSDCTKGSNYIKSMGKIRQDKYEKAINDGRTHITEADTVRAMIERAPTPDSAKILEALKAKAIDEGMQSFRQANMAMPKDPGTYLAMAVLYRDMKDYPNAIEAYKKAIQVGGEKPELISSVAECFILIPLWDSSIVWYQKELTANPKDTTALSNIAVAYYSINDKDKWYEYAQKVLELEPNNSEFLGQCGSYWHMNMMEISSQEADIQDTDKDAQTKRTELEKKRLDAQSKAIGYYEKAVAINPKSPDVLRGLGLLYLIGQENVKASETLEKYLALDSCNTEVLDFLGRAYINLAQHEAAAHTYERLTECDPNNAGAWERLVELYAFLNQTDKAEKAKAKAQELKK